MSQHELSAVMEEKTKTHNTQPEVVFSPHPWRGVARDRKGEQIKPTDIQQSKFENSLLHKTDNSVWTRAPTCAQFEQKEYLIMLGAFYLSGAWNLLNKLMIVLEVKISFITTQKQIGAEMRAHTKYGRFWVPHTAYGTKTQPDHWQGLSTALKQTAFKTTERRSAFDCP